MSAGDGAADAVDRQGGHHLPAERADVRAGGGQPHRVGVEPQEDHRGEHPGNLLKRYFIMLKMFSVHENILSLSAAAHAHVALRSHLPHARPAGRALRQEARQAPRQSLLQVTFNIHL